MWEKFENQGHRPFPGAVILGDSAYALTQWLITPFHGQPDGPRGRFNLAHARTRNVVERAFGVIKKRFYALSTGLRFRDMKQAAKAIECGFLLHNLAIKFGDAGEDLSECPDDSDEDEAVQAGTEGDEEDPNRERRRNQILQCFL